MAEDFVIKTEDNIYNDRPNLESYGDESLKYLEVSILNHEHKNYSHEEDISCKDEMVVEDCVKEEPDYFSDHFAEDTEVIIKDSNRNEEENALGLSSSAKMGPPPPAVQPFNSNMEVNNEDITSKKQCKCIVERLLIEQFSSKTYADKARLIEDGRPTPGISLRGKTKNCIRKFNKAQYERTKWLTACPCLHKLYCWPCLLFNEEVGTWNSYGFIDLNNLHKAIKRHEISFSHITSVIELTRFRKPRSDLNSQPERNVQIHNENVKKNREILKRLIDVVCFLGEQQLAFRCYDESTDFDNKGNYIELLNLCKKYDPLLAMYLEESSIFSVISNKIQNELINCVGEVLSRKIISEIVESSFAAIILDETNDIKTISQLSCVVRYVLRDGNVCERFLGFINVSTDPTAEGLSKVVSNKVEELKIGPKLVAQTYDGAIVMSSKLNELQKRVKEKYPNAFFIHSMAHRLNSVLSQSVSNMELCANFFSKLKSFSLFFAKPNERVHLLDIEIKKRFPKVAPTRWNFNDSLVEIVLEYREQLIDLFQIIIDDCSKWDTESYTYAQVLQSNLEDCEFNFLLNVFGDIFICTNTVIDVLQNKMFDIFPCICKVNEIVEALQDKKNEFSKIWSTVDGTHPSLKRKKNGAWIGEGKEGSPEDIYRRLFYQIIDLICEQIKVRFQDLDHLSFLELLDARKVENKNAFPEHSLTSLKNSYGEFFNFQMLRGELTVLYNDKELKGKPVDELLRILRNSGLDSALPQLTKFCELTLTLPVTSASAERPFSYLRRIHNYTRNAQGEERLSSLAQIVIERDLLKNIKNDMFYENVINLFNEKETRIELTFR